MAKGHEFFHEDNLKVRGETSCQKFYSTPTRTYHIRLTIACFGLKSNNSFLVRSVPVSRVFDLKINEIDSIASIDSGHVS